MSTKYLTNVICRQQCCLTEDEFALSAPLRSSLCLCVRSSVRPSVRQTRALCGKLRAAMALWSLSWRGERARVQGLKPVPRFSEFCLCSCLPLLPQLVCNIHATWGPPLGGALDGAWPAVRKLIKSRRGGGGLFVTHSWHASCAVAS